MRNNLCTQGVTWVRSRLRCERLAFVSFTCSFWLRNQARWWSTSFLLRFFSKQVSALIKNSEPRLAYALCCRVHVCVFVCLDEITVIRTIARLVFGIIGSFCGLQRIQSVRTAATATEPAIFTTSVHALMKMVKELNTLQATRKLGLLASSTRRQTRVMQSLALTPANLIPLLTSANVSWKMKLFLLQLSNTPNGQVRIYLMFYFRMHVGDDAQMGSIRIETHNKRNPQ